MSHHRLGCDTRHTTRSLHCKQILFTRVIVDYYLANEPSQFTKFIGIYDHCACLRKHRLAVGIMRDSLASNHTRREALWLEVPPRSVASRAVAEDPVPVVQEQTGADTQRFWTGQCLRLVQKPRGV